MRGPIFSKSRTRDPIFRKAVIELGGIRVPSDYEDLPHWCKRKRGRPIDEIVSELRPYGYYFEDANGLYDYLIKH